MPTAMYDFDNYVECEYKLSGLTIVELKSIASEITHFSTVCASFIHSGFDNDPILEYHQIWVNVSEFNGYSLDILEMDETKLYEHHDSITLKSYTLCKAKYCRAVSDEGAVSFNHTKFVDFVRFQFQEHFRKKETNSDSDELSQSRRLRMSSDIEFAILRVGEAMDLRPKSDDLTLIHYLYSICAAVALVGLIACVYEKGFIPFVRRRVDTSGWTAWIGLALQLWDILSDILLSREMWSKQNWRVSLMDPRNRLLFIAAVGSTSFLVIPYVLNLYIACIVKRYIKSNEAAMAWFVVRYLLTTSC